MKNLRKRVSRWVKINKNKKIKKEAYLVSKTFRTTPRLMDRSCYPALNKIQLLHMDNIGQNTVELDQSSHNKK